MLGKFNSTAMLPRPPRASDRISDGEGVSEDAIKNAEIDVQELTDKYVKQLDGMLEHKESEIMTV